MVQIAKLSLYMSSWKRPPPYFTRVVFYVVFASASRLRVVEIIVRKKNLIYSVSGLWTKYFDTFSYFFSVYFLFSV